MNKLVSIIVPIYNGAEDIEKCMDGLLGQTYRNKEIILVNNGSTDDSYVLCQAYEEQYPGIVHVLDLTVAGVSNARNIGFEQSKGEYIMFFDNDDYLYHDSVEKMVAYLEKTNADIVVASYKRIFSGSSSKLTKNHKYNVSLSIPKDTAQTIEENKSILVDVYTAPWGKIYRREALLVDTEFPLFHLEYLRNQDLDFTLRQMLTGGKIAFLDEEILDYFVYEKSTSIKKMLNVDNTINIFNDVECYYKKYGKFDEFDEELTYLKAYHLLLGEVYRVLLYGNSTEEIDKLIHCVAFSELKNNKYYKKLPGVYRLYIRSLLTFSGATKWVLKLVIK